MIFQKTGIDSKSRRNFFLRFAYEVIHLAEEVSGNHKLNTGDLEKLPDHIIRTITPVFNPAHKIIIENGLFTAEVIKTKNVYTCPVDRESAYVLSLFTGKYTMEEIGAMHDKEFCQKNDGFKIAGKLFLKLSKQFICHPLEPLSNTDE